MQSQRWQAITEMFDAAVNERLVKTSQLKERFPHHTDRLLQEVKAMVASDLEHGHTLIPSIPRIPTSFIPPETGVPQLLPGQKVRDYTIIRLLGEGAFSRVYLARQDSLGRSVALKVSYSLAQEARNMATINHSHIVQIYSTFYDDDLRLHGICMQFIPGLTLEALLRHIKSVRRHPTGKDIIDFLDLSCRHLDSLPMDPEGLKYRSIIENSSYHDVCLALCLRVAEALAAAHQRGILHLDVKPANILIDVFGRAYLADFNISLDQKPQNLGTPKLLGGTLLYTSPEQKSALESGNIERFHDIDGRSDLFGLGAVLKDMLDTCPVDAGLQDAFSQLLGRCLAIDPLDRFDSARDLIDGLETTQEMVRIQDRFQDKCPLARLIRRRPVLTLVTAALLPQGLGALFNFCYNSFRIIAYLNEPQRRVFHQTLGIYSLLMTPFIALLLWQRLGKLGFQVIEAQKNGTRAQQLRKTLLESASTLTWISALTWLPGSLLFPLVIEFLSGPIAASAPFHFLISGVIAWLLATSYSRLSVEYVVMLALYPRCWSLSGGIARIARQELADVPRKLAFDQGLTSLTPLLAASLIIGISVSDLSPLQLQIYRYLTLSLLVLSTVGFVFSLHISHRIKGFTQVMSQSA